MARTSATGPIRSTGLESPRSDVPQQVQPDLAAAPTSPKRGRGRPPKSNKSDSTQTGAVKPKPRVSGRLKTKAATGSIAAAVMSTRTRPKRSNAPPATASQVTTSGTSKKRGRPRKDDVAAATATATKRGRKAKVAINSPRRTTRKISSVAPVAANDGDLKKKTALLKKKVKEAAAKLKLAVTAIEAAEAIAAGM